MTEALRIVAAAPQHAAAVAALWRDSIVLCCAADHRGEQAVLAGWLANKTPEHLASAFAQPDLCWRVALDAVGAPLGIGLLGPAGEVRALYVAPSRMRRGVGARLLAEMESIARAQGARRLTLDSTATAHAFYRAQGFCDCGAPQPCCGVLAQPMVKTLE
ncbi:MAG: GNAT family N-acetyltransferase [Rhodospirillaceae bacterium]